MPQVPPAWTDAMGHFRAAQVEMDAFRSPMTSGPGRDLAMARYATSVDALMAALGRLSEDGTLGRITLTLARKERV